MKHKKLIKFRKSILLATKGVELIALWLLMMMFWVRYYPTATFSYQGNYLVAALYVALLVIFFPIYGGLKIGVLRLPEVIFSSSLSLVFSNTIMYAQFLLVARQFLDPLPMLFIFIVQLMAVMICAAVINRLYFVLYPARNVVLFYGDPDSAETFRGKVRRISEKYKLCGTISQDEDWDYIKNEYLEKYNSFMLIDTTSKFRDKVLGYCFDQNKRVYLVPNPNDIIVQNATKSTIFDTPMLLCKNRGPTMEQMIIKRLFDMVCSFLGLIIASPFMLVIAVSIKLYDKGPVLFTQERMTRNQNVFKLYKFRSMIVDADKGTDQLMVSKGDSRITPVGRVIRKLRVDELPQLINILKGDMSFVGPRPERLELVEEYSKALPEFLYRHKMKAGLTGLAQVMGKYNTSPRDKLLFDLMYIEEFSLWQDLKILFMTFKVVFLPGASDGIDDGKDSAL